MNPLDSAWKRKQIKDRSLMLAEIIFAIMVMGVIFTLFILHERATDRKHQAFMQSLENANIENYIKDNAEVENLTQQL